VGLGDVLFGRRKLKEAARDRIYALSTASITLETELGLTSAGSAAVVFKPLSAEDFRRAGEEIEQLLGAVTADFGSKVRRESDDFGYEWLVIEDPDLEDLVNGVHLVASELEARGFSGQLLAAVFKFKGRADPVFLVYGYKRGAFWPFVPTGGEARDNSAELELRAKLEKELPIEQDLTRWFGLFGAPL
jgi:PspAB-like protein